jgi:hypothetical protein
MITYYTLEYYPTTSNIGVMNISNTGIFKGSFEPLKPYNLSNSDYVRLPHIDYELLGRVLEAKKIKLNNN